MKKVKSIQKAIETSDGAGVKLNRVFGYNETPRFDPFLLLDYFVTDDPDDVSMGFPWHPHRGIETITYILRGAVEHQDSLGNKGLIGRGDVQWMSAGSGIIHQEMPKAVPHGIEGFQLWLNLPAKRKMSTPLYGEVKASMIKEVKSNKTSIRIIGGTLGNTEGPILRHDINVKLFDISMPPGEEYIHSPEKGANTFIFVYSGHGYFGTDNARVGEKSVMLFEGDGGIMIKAGEDLRFLLGEGNPINEPIAWGGPIVMNTREELMEAFSEYEEGTFIKT